MAAMAWVDTLFVTVWLAIVLGGAYYARVYYDTTFDELVLFTLTFSNFASVAHKFIDPLFIRCGFKIGRAHV